MTLEEKQLLIRDLYSRLPYKVNVAFYLYTTHEWFTSTLRSINPTEETYRIGNQDYDNFTHIKPYLRPMSSMSEDEKEKLKSKCLHTETEEDWEGVRSDSWGIEILDKYDTERWDNTIYVSSIINMDAIDWLNAHHFDYRGLIEMGLALEAPEGMYKTD